MEELKEIIADDSRANQILDKISKENRKYYRRQICGIVLFFIGIAGICCSIISCVIRAHNYIICIFLAVALLLLYIAGCLTDLFGDAKEVIRDDELLYLNAILKERSVVSIGKLPIIHKGQQCFIEENGVLEYIGKAENQTMVECEKFSFKRIEDWEGLSRSRYLVFQCSETRY